MVIILQYDAFFTKLADVLDLSETAHDEGLACHMTCLMMFPFIVFNDDEGLLSHELPDDVSFLRFCTGVDFFERALQRLNKGIPKGTTFVIQQHGDDKNWAYTKGGTATSGHVHHIKCNRVSAVGKAQTWRIV